MGKMFIHEAIEYFKKKSYSKLIVDSEDQETEEINGAESLAYHLVFNRMEIMDVPSAVFFKSEDSHLMLSCVEYIELLTGNCEAYDTIKIVYWHPANKGNKSVMAKGMMTVFAKY